MTYTLGDSKREKEVNKFQKQWFICETPALESLPATLVKRDYNTSVFL